MIHLLLALAIPVMAQTQAPNENGSINSRIDYLETQTLLNNHNFSVLSSSVNSAVATIYSTISALNTVGWVTDNLIGQVNGVTTNFTLSQTPSSPGSLQIILDGLLQSRTSDYTYTSGTTFSMTAAPSANSSSFFATYSTGSISGGAVVNTSSQAIITTTYSGNNTSFHDCFTTITVTTDGGPYRMIFSGNMAVDTNGETARATILMDGGFISPWSATLPMMRSNSIGAGGVLNMEVNFNYYFTPSAGTHTFCVAGMVSTGAASWNMLGALRPFVFRIESAK